MIQIPRQAGILSRLACKDQLRYALSGIQLVANGTESRLIATDGHVLGIVRGPAVPPGSEACVLIPLPAWVECFKHAKDGHVEVHKESLAAVGKTQTVVGFEPLDGRFPDYMRVLPSLLPLATANVNPRLLIKVLEVAAAIAETRGDDTSRVQLYFYKPNVPLGMTAKGADLTFDGLVMPLS